MPQPQLCEGEGVWLHIDAAYAGPAAMLPEHEWIFDGTAQADSATECPLE